MVDWVAERDFYEGADVARALRCAESVIAALSAQTIDPLLRQAEIQLALEVVCDAPDGSPERAFQAVQAIETRYRRPELWEDDRPSAHRLRIACWLALAAEVAHRAERYRQAVAYCLSAFTYLDAAAGSREELQRRMASSKDEAISEAATAVFAIWLAAMRRAAYSAETSSALRESAPDLLPAFLASGKLYPRTHALSTQALFDQAERGEVANLEELRAISDQTRPASLRAQATAPLVGMEFARAQGMTEVAAREGQLAEERLKALDLQRHLERIKQYGYLVD